MVWEKSGWYVSIFQSMTIMRRHEQIMSKMTLRQIFDLPNAIVLYQRKCWVAANRHQAPSSLTLCVQISKMLGQFQFDRYLFNANALLGVSRRRIKNHHVNILLTFHEFDAGFTKIDLNAHNSSMTQDSSRTHKLFFFRF